jgi:hypothetical protein
MKRALIPALLIFSAVLAPRISDLGECPYGVSQFASTFARPLSWALWEDLLNLEIARFTQDAPEGDDSAQWQSGPFACWIFRAFLKGAFERGLSFVSGKKFSTLSISPSLIRRESGA